jgi:hypothetical protein
MIDTAVWRPSWACQWPRPAFLPALRLWLLDGDEDVFAIEEPEP